MYHLLTWLSYEKLDITSRLSVCNRVEFYSYPLCCANVRPQLVNAKEQLKTAWRSTLGLATGLRYVPCGRLLSDLNLALKSYYAKTGMDPHEFFLRPSHRMSVDTSSTKNLRIFSCVVEYCSTSPASIVSLPSISVFKLKHYFSRHHLLPYSTLL